MDQKELPRIAGKLRSKYLEMPEEIYRAKGIVIMGKRIKSVIFTTDIAIIRSCNADAVLAAALDMSKCTVEETVLPAKLDMPVPERSGQKPALRQ